MALIDRGRGRFYAGERQTEHGFAGGPDDITNAADLGRMENVERACDVFSEGAFRRVDRIVGNGREMDDRVSAGEGIDGLAEIGEIDHAGSSQRLPGHCAIEIGDFKSLLEEMADDRLAGLAGASGYMHVSLVHVLKGNELDLSANGK